MLSRFFGERTGGIRFFEELDRAKADPSVNYDLLELMHACLALGFQGIHRTSAGGAANLQMIQRNLFETLRRVKQPAPELSPRWRGQAIAAAVTGFKVPVWSAAAIAAVALLGVYFVFRALLSGNAEAASTALLSVHPKGEIGIMRKVFSTPPPPPPVLDSPSARPVDHEVSGDKTGAKCGQPHDRPRRGWGEEGVAGGHGKATAPVAFAYRGRRPRTVLAYAASSAPVAAVPPRSAGTASGTASGRSAPRKTSLDLSMSSGSPSQSTTTI